MVKTSKGQPATNGQGRPVHGDQGLAVAHTRRAARRLWGRQLPADPPLLRPGTDKAIHSPGAGRVYGLVGAGPQQGGVRWELAAPKTTGGAAGMRYGESLVAVDGSTLAIGGWLSFACLDHCMSFLATNDK